MRTITDTTIKEAVAKLCMDGNLVLPQDIKSAMAEKKAEDPWTLAKETLSLLEENATLAEKEGLPICQDTGMVSVYVTLGQEVQITGDFQQAIQDGVALGYQEGYLRCSMVADPLRRVNTGDNTPASITVELIPGDIFRMTVVPKGFGSENMSRLGMLKPAQGVEGVKDFVLETIALAGPNACPPMVVGVGIGGNFEKAPYLAKKAMLRSLDTPNKDIFYQDLECTLLDSANKLGIGPQGFGGKTTVLGVAIEVAPTHVAGLPVAVNIGCHVTRRASCVL